MPEPEEPPKFSAFPSQPPNERANESFDATKQNKDPFDRNDPWSGCKPTGAPDNFDLFGDPNKPNDEVPKGTPRAVTRVQVTLPSHFFVNSSWLWVVMHHEQRLGQRPIKGFHLRFLFFKCCDFLT